MDWRTIAKMNRLYLLVSNPELGRIDYLHVSETQKQNGRPHGSLAADDRGFRPLVFNLKDPSYIHYSFETKNLFVCDSDRILRYEIMHTEDGIITLDETILIAEIECAGLDTDRWGNLFYADRNDRAIKKIWKADLDDFSAEDGADKDIFNLVMYD